MGLTEEIVERARYEGESYRTKSGRKRWTEHVVWDSGPPGLGLRITSTQRKSYVVSYRERGRRRTRRLGSPDELSLAEARRRADQILGVEAAGQTAESASEPPPQSPRAPAIVTVADLADLYLERHLEAHSASPYAAKRLLRAHVKPMVGRVPLAEFGPMELANLRSRLAPRLPGEARKVSQLLTDMLAWADERGLRAGGGAAAETGVPEATGVRGAAAVAVPVTEPDDAARVERAELSRRLDEVAASGAEMMEEIHRLTEERRALEIELEQTRRRLERERTRAVDDEWSEEARKTRANLQASVDQLITALNKAEAERDAFERELEEATAAAKSARAEAYALRRQSTAARVAADERKAVQRDWGRRAGGRAMGRAAVGGGRGGRRSAIAAALAGALLGALATWLLLAL